MVDLATPPPDAKTPVFFVQLCALREARPRSPHAAQGSGGATVGPKVRPGTRSMRRMVWGRILLPSDKPAKKCPFFPCAVPFASTRRSDSCSLATTGRPKELERERASQCPTWPMSATTTGCDRAYGARGELLAARRPGLGTPMRSCRNAFSISPRSRAFDDGREAPTLMRRASGPEHDSQINK